MPRATRFGIRSSHKFVVEFHDYSQRSKHVNRVNWDRAKFTMVFLSSMFDRSYVNRENRIRRPPYLFVTVINIVSIVASKVLFSFVLGTATYCPHRIWERQLMVPVYLGMLSSRPRLPISSRMFDQPLLFQSVPIFVL